MAVKKSVEKLVKKFDLLFFLGEKDNSGKGKEKLLCLSSAKVKLEDNDAEIRYINGLYMGAEFCVDETNPNVIHMFKLKAHTSIATELTPYTGKRRTLFIL